MIDIFLEWIFLGLGEKVFNSSSLTSPKKIKILHAVVRTSIYFFCSGLFVYLSIRDTGLKKLIYLVFAMSFFVSMLITNYTSYKRQKNWKTIQKNIVKHEN
ncbi:hypothetical protein HED39_17170 [Enterococcus casseliflavus]|uniref:hypothetical protein n=1 Tax=Enterococcus casseliflavus TaxID=37734 RepID=UPI001432BFEF|nr:hypothetical protein [Enterococcus casseliflavus]NKD31009.1 hypothetical protein [Enterococcus casseliflavus]